MGQEFIIKSQNLEDKINQLLPSQGGFQAGVDLSASTQIVPIVDLTETAEGSLLRQDLQTAMSLSSNTAFAIINTTTTLINTTGYFRVFGTFMGKSVSSVDATGSFTLTDGATSKDITKFVIEDSSTVNHVAVPFDFIIFSSAGDSLTATTTNGARLIGSTRQVATITGELVNPN